MCGIAGIVGSEAAIVGSEAAIVGADAAIVGADTAIVGADVDRGTIERMTAVLSHRGPDDHGVFRAPGVQLGHRRLSILDLSAAGHQPMECGALTITYNGEIYNYRELREQLGGEWRSHTDTEVVLRLYRRYGDGCVDYLNGMFAFAIWDAERRRLFAARDRLGIKPLLYRELPGGLAFASEIKSLLELGRPPIEPSSLRDYFAYKYVPAPKTIYRGIHKLPPGHTLTYDGTDDGSLRVRRYWSPEVSSSITDPEQALEELAGLLPRAVREHTLADVPVGVFLSAGLDSTALAVHLDRPSTFTLGFGGGRHDETAGARETAEHVGSIHREEIASAGDLEEALDGVAEMYDEPFGDSGAWAIFLISRFTRRHVKVVLSGEGGDELFAGYHWYDKFVRFGRRWDYRLGARLLPPFARGARSLQRRAASGLERYGMFAGPFTPRQRRSLLARWLIDTEYDDLWHLRAYWRDDLDPIKRLQWADLNTYLPEDVLTKLDRATMAVSLEARPPLLDHRLVEFCLALDGSLLSDGKRRKLLLRRHLSELVPPSTFDRPKIGFTLPVRQWMTQHPQALPGALSRLAKGGVLRSSRVRPMNNEQIWALLVLDRWLERSGATV